MKKQDQKFHKNVDRVEIEYYTDPLCCWSWAFEPQWRRLRYEYSGKVAWRYRMSGLLPNWDSYNDPMNSVSRPIQMGPIWQEAHYTSGMPINSQLWFKDPPASSYPACIAVKCAALQSPNAAEAYLRYLREAVMLKSKNISKNEVLIDLAMGLEKEFPKIFQAQQFEKDLKANAGLEGFQADMQKASYHKINRFPTLTIHKVGQPGMMIIGYRPYNVLVTALEQAAPGIRPTQYASSEEDYKHFWGSTISREVEEALESVSKVE